MILVDFRSISDRVFAPSEWYVQRVVRPRSTDLFDKRAARSSAEPTLNSYVDGARPSHRVFVGASVVSRTSSRQEGITLSMKRIHRLFIQGRFPVSLALLCGFISLAGCDSGGADASRPAPAQPSPSNSARSVQPAATKSKTEASSRRQHQKEQAGKAP